MKDTGNKKPTGRVNYVWVMAGGYLLYLAVQLFRGVIDGTGGNMALGIGGGVVYAVVGVLLLRREWKAYQYGQAHKDDPTTWSDETAEEAALPLEEPPEESEETP